MYVCMCVCVYVCLFLYECVCVCVCVYLCMYVSNILIYLNCSRIEKFESNFSGAMDTMFQLLKQMEETRHS